MRFELLSSSPFVARLSFIGAKPGVCAQTPAGDGRAWIGCGTATPVPPREPSRRSRFWWWLVGSCLCLPVQAAWGGDIGSAVSSAAAASRGGRELSRAVAPLVKALCFECHNEKKSKGGVNLEKLVENPDFAAHFKTWEKVITVLEQEEMPPEGKPQPSPAERRELATALRDRLENFIRQNAGDPGRVVVRQLTSAEYAYTIRDLTGLDLGLERGFANDAAGGEGFSNVGGAQFMQDSALERYLEAAKIVASHAVIGAGSLRFYADPGKTGQELSAIHRIDEIYRRHGFRSGAGEGGEAYGQDRYAHAMHAAWRFRFRRQLGLGGASLAGLARVEGIDGRFAEYIWGVLHEPTASIPLSEIIDGWRNLPRPAGGASSGSIGVAARAACGVLADRIGEWQVGLAPHPADPEDGATLTEGSFHPALKRALRVLVRWSPGSTNAAVVLSVFPAARQGESNTIVRWRQPRIRLRSDRPRFAGTFPLHSILSSASSRKIEFGKGIAGAPIEKTDFITVGPVALPISFAVDEGSGQAELSVEVELDVEGGSNWPALCVVSGSTTGSGRGSVVEGRNSIVLSSPDGPASGSWISGVREFARKLPQSSHREAAPADKDPIPEPYDNTYNTAERNSFHSQLKYYRDDQFLVQHVLDDATRRLLDEAWVDLLASFDYHDTFLGFVDRKFNLGLGSGVRAGSLSDELIHRIPVAARKFVENIRDEHRAMKRRLEAAEPGHLEEAMRFVELAWRRPLASEETDRLRDFYSALRKEDGLGHSEAFRMLLARILAAPSFLYRAETPVAAAGVKAGGSDARRLALSDWELASRLSYFLWSSIPDEPLRRAAAAGVLRRPGELARQAQRMLRHPRARRFAAEFFGQWFGFYRFDGHRGVDTERFAEFTDELKSAMYDEAISFFEHVVREDRPIQDILFADYSFLNRDLARHYGIVHPSLSTNRLELVSGIGSSHRGGLLGLGAVLTVTSAPLRTSAVKRGDWMLRRVLGTPVPPPPGDAGSIPAEDVLPDRQTVRERLEAHRSDASCVNCHARIDPLGFALEHFDSIGRWRETYRDGQRIDTAGTLSDGTRIDGLEGLHHYLRGQEAAFHKTLCSKLLGYALGRGELVSDRPLIGRMQASLQKGGGFGSVVAQVVASPQFRFLRRPAAEVAPDPRGASPHQQAE